MWWDACDDGDIMTVGSGGCSGVGKDGATVAGIEGKKTWQFSQ